MSGAKEGTVNTQEQKDILDSAWINIKSALEERGDRAVDDVIAVEKRYWERVLPQDEVTGIIQDVLKELGLSSGADSVFSLDTVHPAKEGHA